ncbi:hypothetical protein MHYP_G00192680 [Metynnis hypsauchen]
MLWSFSSLHCIAPLIPTPAKQAMRQRGASSPQQNPRGALQGPMPALLPQNSAYHPHCLPDTINSTC